MHAASFRRAEAFLKDQSTERFFVGFLGVLEALMALKLVVVVGLMLSLTTTPRFTYFSSPSLPPRVAGGPSEAEALVRFPASARRHAERIADPDVWVLSDAGLTPIALMNLESGRPTLKLWGHTLRSMIRMVPALGSSRPALLILLMSGLGLVVALALVLRVRVIMRTRLVLKVADSLRNLIHRQIYRLGQTSLPAEGTGPVINLFTREVNDVRSGLEAEMSQSPRVWVLAVGLFLMTLLIDPALAVSLFALWALIGLAAFSLIKQRKLQEDLASRDSAVQLSLLQEDLGLLRHGSSARDGADR